MGSRCTTSWNGRESDLSIDVKTLPPQADYDPRYDFHNALERYGLDLKPLSIETLQVNLTKLCNQACRHCHVDASPKRTEQMDLETVEKCLEILEQNPALQKLDLTGGA